MQSGWLDSFEPTADPALLQVDTDVYRSSFDRLISALRWVIVVLLFSVSPFALLVGGWQYFDTGGSPLEKFHPATLLVGVLLVMVAFRRGNPLAGLAEIGQHNAALLPYAAAVFIMTAYSGIILKLPVTLFIEVFLAAGLVLVLFRDLPERESHRLALTIHVLLFANALLAFAEVAWGFHTTPIIVNGELLDEEPRATALLGHPLANSMVMGSYVLALALGGGRDLPVLARAVLFLAALASLVPFGGRAATAFAILALAGILGRKLWLIARGAPFDPRTVLAGLVLIPLSCLGLIVGYEMGALDTLAQRLVNDEGSAGTRLEMFELFKHLDNYDLLFGPNPDKLFTWVRLHGLEYGIESFPVAFVLNYGFVPALMFFPALIWFLIQLARACRPDAWIVIAYYIAVAMTSISLSAKTPTLSVFCLVVLILLRNTDGVQESSASRHLRTP